MNILLLEWKNYCVTDMAEALREAGHCVIQITCPEITDKYHPDFHTLFLQLVEKTSCDIVFTFNYYPIISKSCNKINLPYVSWVYDNPLMSLYSYTVIYPCNYIFLFDYAAYKKFHSEGISTIHYLPLCANPKRLCQNSNLLSISNDITFVGSLYNEPRQQLYERLNTADSYTRGYIDALTYAQSKISGYFFLEEFLTDDILNGLQKAYPVSPNPDGAETSAYIYAQYFLGRRATFLERHDILSALSEHFQVNLYTHEKPADLPNVLYRGKIDYYDTMPSVFRQSKINLNITLKTIETGIPLRVWDIFGCGGFVLSNFQEELCDYFIPNEDFVYYTSTEDAIDKARYYLTHEKERKEIAYNGLEKIKAAHTFQHRIESMFEIIKQ